MLLESSLLLQSPVFMGSKKLNSVKILSFICQVMGILVGLGAHFLLQNYKRNSLFFYDTYITLPAFLAVACAVFLVLGGLMGCCLSKDSPCMQGMVRFGGFFLCVHQC